MTNIMLGIDIDHDIESVWERLADLASHRTWMTDADRIDFVGAQREGVGTTMAVVTRIGPFRVTDVMVVTAWDEPDVISVVHEGLVTGEGDFTLTRTSGGTRLDWNESLSFPLRLGGSLGEVIAAPILRRIWVGNLNRFAASVGEAG